jgi:hypothetical protein
MVVAELQTEHFQFMAIARSEKAAREKVAECFLRHLTQTFDGDRQTAVEYFLINTYGDLEAGELEKLPWVENVEEWYGIRTWDFRESDMLRDCSPIILKEES